MVIGVSVVNPFCVENGDMREIVRDCGNFIGKMRSVCGCVSELRNSLEVRECFSNDEVGGVHECVDAVVKKKRACYQKAPCPHRMDITRV